MRTYFVAQGLALSRRCGKGGIFPAGFCQQLHLARLSQLATRIGVSTAKNAKNPSPIKATARKSRRSEDQVAFHVA
jgi:hypothetical protein